LTTRNYIKAPGTSTGEVEYVLYFDGRGKILVTVGSDHTDRSIEKEDVAKSKETCRKPIAKIFWDYDEVRDHWDKLVLRSFVYNFEVSKKELYQEHDLSYLLYPEDIIEFLRQKESPLKKSVYFCGTIPLLDSFVYGDAYELELEDPILRRTIKHFYVVFKDEE
jgi:hypothetical protein